MKKLSILTLVGFMLLVPLASGQGPETINLKPITINEEHEDSNPYALYDLLFPNSNVSNSLKQKILDSLNYTNPTPIPVYEGQEELGMKAATLAREISLESDPKIKAQKQSELDKMTIPLLKAGLVVADKYKQDPDVWRYLLDEFTEKSDEGAKVTNISHRTYDYKVALKHHYYCQYGWLLCKTPYIEDHITEGSLTAPAGHIFPSHTFRNAFVETFTKIQYIGEHFPQTENVNHWISVKSGNAWVGTCSHSKIFT